MYPLPNSGYLNQQHQQHVQHQYDASFMDASQQTTWAYDESTNFVNSTTTDFGSDPFLLPPFTTVFRQQPTETAQPSSIYFDTPQPQYANLVEPGTVPKSGHYNNEEQQFGDLLSPGISEFYCDQQQQQQQQQQQSHQPQNYDVQSPANFSIYPGASSYLVENFPQQSNFQTQFFVEGYSTRKDATTDTVDLPLTGSRKKLEPPLPVGHIQGQILQVPERIIPRPFTCQVCKSSFSRNWTLKQHMGSHLGLKSFYCPLCGKSFTRRQNATHHLRNQHKLPNPTHWAISSGDKVESDEELLKETIVKTLDNSFRCLVCRHIFRPNVRESMLISHARRHGANYCCMATLKCRKRFRSVEALLNHCQYDHSYDLEAIERIDCSQCHLSFNDWIAFQNHLLQHATTSIREIKQSLNAADSNFNKRFVRCVFEILQTFFFLKELQMFEMLEKVFHSSSFIQTR